MVQHKPMTKMITRRPSYKLRATPSSCPLPLLLLTLKKTPDASTPQISTISALPTASTSTSQSKDSNMSNISLPPAYSAIENTGVVKPPEGAGIRRMGR
ncbi:hypothetical protein TESG_07628 [Trichophyton tonsurans CBS 112818]|uniref:Uncharacterized protein n=1 Tax=Trichophyton tonsurans (strain CBS 112818) TaxID=647933 RepID=F2S9L5_TRIT1|nr:hypothetical protein TESG_07628 [Trichophyton tonsurans CBS 112818]